MLQHVLRSIKFWIVIRRQERDLCRFDCRCLEDIGLQPTDLMACIGRKNRAFKHHPSWDTESVAAMHQD